MACVMSDEPLSIPEAMHWARRHSYRSHATVNDMVSEDPSPQWLSWSSWSVMNFTVPIHEFGPLDSKRWTSPISSANLYLRRRLFPYKTETPLSCFRIMDLPVEVREMVFEYALLTPHSGIWYDFQTRYNRSSKQYNQLRVWTRDRDFAPSQYPPDTWKVDKDWLRAQPKALFRVDLHSHLALFRVSKLVYKEAFPCFYFRNVFYISDDYAFLKLFQKLSDEQFCYLTHVVWRWTKTGPPSEKHVQQFAALPRLRTLVIDSQVGEDEQPDLIFDWNRNIR
jgi:hypothetical protein